MSHEILAGRTVVVAGGTGNVGRVLVRGLFDAGATVIVPTRSIQTERNAEAAADGPRIVMLPGNVSDETDAARIRDDILARFGAIHATIATLGHFVPAPTLLGATRHDLDVTLESYPVAHFVVARTFIPAVDAAAGSYVFINGPLAFDPLFPGTGLVSVATAAQAMLARVIMKEADAAHSRARINEVVLYTSFGRPDDANAAGPVTQGDVGDFIVQLLSPTNQQVRNQTIHLDQRRRLGNSSPADDQDTARHLQF